MRYQPALLFVFAITVTAASIPCSCKTSKSDGNLTCSDASGVEIVLGPGSSGTCGGQQVNNAASSSSDSSSSTSNMDTTSVNCDTTAPNSCKNIAGNDPVVGGTPNSSAMAAEQEAANVSKQGGAAGQQAAAAGAKAGGYNSYSGYS